MTLDLLNAVPTWVIMLVTALLIVVFNELGFRVATTLHKEEGEREGPTAVAQAAAFTLVGLILGFSFSLTLGRYDARRAAIVQEANAIRTAVLRTDLLDAKTAPVMRATLRQYVAARLHFVRQEADPNQQAIAQRETDAVQQRLWRLAATEARRDPRSTLTPLFISALNDAISASVSQRAVLNAHIPDVVVFGLQLLMIVTSIMMGYGYGIRGHSAWVSKVLFALTLALVIGLVLDLDRPQRGLIRVNLAPMESVQRL